MMTIHGINWRHKYNFLVLNFHILHLFDYFLSVYYLSERSKHIAKSAFEFKNGYGFFLKGL